MWKNQHFLLSGPCQQRVPEDTGTPSKALIRREILKHVMRMSNPVWIKLSKQTLLQWVSSMNKPRRCHTSLIQNSRLRSAVNKHHDDECFWVKEYIPYYMDPKLEYTLWVSEQMFWHIEAHKYRREWIFFLYL